MSPPAAHTAFAISPLLPEPAAGAASGVDSALGVPGSCTHDQRMTESLRRHLGPIALGLAVVLLLASGILGVGRPLPGLANSNADVAFFYAAGDAWTHGVSPYDYDSLV